MVVLRHGKLTSWDSITGTGWLNTELRTYEFADPSGQDVDASLKETKPSWRNRRGSEVPLTLTEQLQKGEAFGQEVAEQSSQLEKELQAASNL